MQIATLPGAVSKKAAEEPPAAPRGALGLSRPKRRPSPKAQTAAVTALAAVLSFALWHRAWARPTTVQIGDFGDGKEYDWFLAWVPYALGHGQNPLFTNLVNYPKGVNLMWGTSVLLPSVVLAPFTALLGPTFSYNLLTSLGPVLSCTFAYVAFKRWAAPLPALAGALIFAFSPYVVAQSLGHPAQALVCSAPLFLVLLHRMFVVQSGRAGRDGLLIGLLAFAQLLTGEEVLADEALLAVTALAVAAYFGRRQLRHRVGYALRGLRSALVSFLALAGPFLAYQFLGPDRAQNVHSQALYSTDLFNFFVPTPLVALSPSPRLSVHFVFDLAEADGYLGLPLVLLVALAVTVARSRRTTWVALALTGAAALLSMGPVLHLDGHQTSAHLPFFLVAHVPVLTNLLPARLTFGMFLGAGWLVAIGLDEVRYAPRAARLSAWPLAVAALAAIAPPPGYPTTVVAPPKSFDASALCPRSSRAAKPVALVVPAMDETDLRWQALAGFCYAMTTDTGITGSLFGDLRQVVPLIGAAGAPAGPEPSMREAVATYFTNHHVTEVIVVPTSRSDPSWTSRDQREVEDWFARLLGERPDDLGGRSPYYIWRHLPPIAQIATGRPPEPAGHASTR